MLNTNTKIYVENLALYNDGKSMGGWLSLPVTEEELETFLEEIVGIGLCDEFGDEYEEFFITDYETDLDMEIGAYANIMNLSDMIDEIEFLEPDEYDALNAFMEYQGNNIENALSCITSRDYLFLPDIDTYEELGRFFFDNYGYQDEVSERMVDYIDFESFGEYQGANGCITKYGYIEVY